jgi:pyrimidine deaminase RibD-like protein
VGAILVAADGRILGRGRSNYMVDAVQAVIENAGLKVVALKEWCVDWVPDQKFREDLSSSTLYLTLEPSPEAKGEMQPPITKLIEQAGIPNVVIGCPSPIPELAYKGATAMHMAGISVRVLPPGDPMYAECVDLIPAYSELVNTKVCDNALVCIS